MVLVNGITAGAAVWGDINFTADNGFYARFFSSQVELDGTIHGAVISYRQAIHPQFFGAGYQLMDAGHTIEQTVFSMDMEMSKHSTFSLWRLAVIIAQGQVREAISLFRFSSVKSGCYK